MEFRIWVETSLDDRILERELVSRLERSACGIGPEEIGLSLEEGKLVLGKVQARNVQTQADVLGAAQGGCLRCGRNQRVKDLRTRTVRTVFGTVQVSCRRYLRCNCQSGNRTTIWPLHRLRVLADGADSMSNLVNASTEKTTHRVLDWFHISMRLRPIEQMSPGIISIVGDADPILTELLREKIHRVRFQMWNGHWQAALDRLGAIYRTTKKCLTTLSSADAERLCRFRKHMLDLRDYLCRNQVAFRNYAQDRRKGLRISSALAESAMSHLVNDRMGKRQRMRWSAEGAHLLLQVRCAVLDNRLELLFREWLPKFRPPNQSST